MKSKGFVVFGVALIILGLVGGVIGMSILDWNFSKLDEQFEAQVYEVEESVTALDFDLDSFDVEIVRGGDFKMDYHKSDRTTFEVKVENGVLKVYEDYSWRHRFMNIFGWINNKYRKIILTVPADIDFTSTKIVSVNSEIEIDGVGLGEVDFATTNGDMELENLSYSSMTLSTTNGGLSLDNVNGGNINFTSTNDAIQVYNSKIGVLDVKTTNGKIETNNCDFADLIIKTTNGKILADNVTSSGYSATTTNGKIFITKLTADNIYLKNTNGSIDAEIKGVQSEYSIVLHTTNGDTNLPNGVGTTVNKKLHAESTNGDVTIDFI